MNQQEATKILEFVSNFQNKAQTIERFVGNPYVKGDNIAEHLARMARLFLYIIPDLKKEFPNEKDLIENTVSCLLVHDDDEVIDGFDIPTALKKHNVKDDEEILKFRQAVTDLPKDTGEHLILAFSTFRKKDSLPAKIAKALDNLVGNQFVIEQKIGLVNPDQTRFAIEYAEKVKGTSKVIDTLVDAQIDQIIECRKQLRKNPSEIGLQKEKADAFLEIDVMTHKLNKDKINLPLEKL
jgi:5'-deoxynucleotidase YfbR-like HD superfamily hydrolase